jgi:hypothetical protein
LGKNRCKWKSDTKTDPKEVGHVGAFWIYLAQDGMQRRARVHGDATYDSRPGGQFIKQPIAYQLFLDVT